MKNKTLAIFAVITLAFTVSLIALGHASADVYCIKTGFNFEEMRWEYYCEAMGW